mmetsp:Transcript_8937/g.20762  ORF Transcript_8937/g.20762 Transcript_8937/m.20762 type:complete len:436 (-) Transcript_8937:40-1347(-)
MTLGNLLVARIPWAILVLVLFLIAVDINPEVADIEQREAARGRRAARRLILSSNLSITGLSSAIDGSNWWPACQINMHSCQGGWFPEMKEYCCCDQGFYWTSSECLPETTTTTWRSHWQDGDASTRGSLLFCSAFDLGDLSDVPEVKDVPSLTFGPTYKEVQRFDAHQLRFWVMDLLKASGYQDSATVGGILQLNEVDGAILLNLSPVGLMKYGIAKDEAETIWSGVEALPRQRRLASGASGCDDTSSGTSGCDEDTGAEEGADVGVHTGSQGCSKSSTGTRGCQSTHSSGAQGCDSQGSGAQGCHQKSGARGCHGHAARGCHSAAQGCDTGVQGCHSGVCGCEGASGLGNAFGLLLFTPFLALFLMVHVLVAAMPLMIMATISTVIVAAFVNGSFLALTCAGLLIVVWAAATLYQAGDHQASHVQLQETDGEGP